MRPRPTEPDSALIDRYAELIGRVEEGELTGDELAREVQGAEGDLEQLLANWRHLDGLMARCGLDGTGTPPLDTATSDFLGELSTRGTSARYRRGAEIGRGGMARVHRARDKDLGRDVAMKVMHTPSERDSGGDGSTELLLRFLEEARIAGQLDHPGIVPVHELGVDSNGEVYFTMPLVDGRDLASILKNQRARDAGDPEWSRTRIVGILLKVCEAMSYAHAKGVLHRDLKPANIMVGRFGETYVMDWGLARAMQRPGEPGRPSRPDTGSEDSALVTLPGQIIGTPAYMAPEQAAALGEVGPLADIYSVGAILYEVLAGTAPYLRAGETGTRRDVLEKLVAGPPTPVANVEQRGDLDAPTEVAAICAKAMARRPEERYASMLELADDLRAYLEGRVVRAHRTGPWVGLRKWAARNRGTAAAVALALLAALAGLVATSRERAQARERLVRLAEVQTLAELVEESEQLWPLTPDLEPQLVDWLERAAQVEERMVGHRASLERLRERALPYSEEARERDRETHPALAEIDGLRVLIGMLAAGHTDVVEAADLATDPSGTVEERIERHEQRIEELLPAIAARRTWEFDDPARAAQHEVLSQLMSDWESFTHPDPRVGALTSVRRRLEQARSDALRELGPREGRWREVRRAILANERYGGLDLSPQDGLLPLGPDPASGWQEFAHLATGTPAERDPDGKLQVTAETGVVLVLLPAGTATVGAIKVPAGPITGDTVPFGDPDARRSELPLAEVRLDAFFLSKYELDQAQWIRMTGGNPSLKYDGFEASHFSIGPTHPIERVSWDDCMRWLPRYDLDLPTEVQWEYAARAGTTIPRWCGPELASLFGAENVDDRPSGIPQGARQNYPHLDGYPSHAPVDSMVGNPWGFHQMLGNVREHCRDAFWVSGHWPRRPGDGLRQVPEEQGNRVTRGSDFNGPLRNARASFRETVKTDYRLGLIGLRPARRVR